MVQTGSAGNCATCPKAKRYLQHEAAITRGGAAIIEVVLLHLRSDLSNAPGRAKEYFSRCVPLSSARSRMRRADTRRCGRKTGFNSFDIPGGTADRRGPQIAKVKVRDPLSLAQLLPSAQPFAHIRRWRAD